MEQIVLADPAYIDRLKRHYRMVRDAVNQNAARSSEAFRSDDEAVGRRVPSATVVDRRLDAAQRKRILAAKMRELHERRSQKKRAR